MIETPETLQQAIAADRARREAEALKALEASLRDIQERFNVDPIVVVRVLPSGACVPGIEWRSR